MLAITISMLLGMLQVSTTGTVVGVVKPPAGAKTIQARVVMLPPKYIEAWNKQVQQRLDNYWETFKPEFFANKEHFADFERLARLEAMMSVVSQMRRELGSNANPFIKQTSPAGEFEFKGIPLGTYQVLVEASADGRDFTFSRPVDVRNDIPIFLDLGKPVS